jgi:hypothetical protein
VCCVCDVECAWIGLVYPYDFRLKKYDFLIVLISGRKVTVFRTLIVAPSVLLFRKLAAKPTKPIIVLSPYIMQISNCIANSKFLVLLASS